jgi:hypothetical protein
MGRGREIHTLTCLWLEQRTLRLHQGVSAVASSQIFPVQNPYQTATWRVPPGKGSVAAASVMVGASSRRTKWSSTGLGATVRPGDWSCEVVCTTERRRQETSGNVPLPSARDRKCRASQCA